MHADDKPLRVGACGYQVKGADKAELIWPVLAVADGQAGRLDMWCASSPWRKGERAGCLWADQPGGAASSGWARPGARWLEPGNPLK